MRKLVGIFSVSVVAVMSVVSARAEVVATTLLDTRLGTTGNLAKVASTGSYADLTNKPAINNATLTIQKNATTVGTFTANASANKTINITVPTKVSELTNDSSFATTTAVDAKVSIAQGTANAGKGLVVDGTSGNLTLTDVATQAELNAHTGSKTNPHGVTKAQVGLGNVDNTSDANKPISTATQTALNAKQDKLVTSGDNANFVAGSNVTLSQDATTGKITVSSKNTTYSTGTSSTAGLTKLYTTTGTNTDGTMTQNAIKTALDGKVSTAQGTGNAGKGLVVNSSGNLELQDIATQTELNAKQNANTAVTHTASTAAGSATVPVYVNASGVATPITSYSGKAATAGTADYAKADGAGNIIVDTYATQAALGDLDSRVGDAEKNIVLLQDKDAEIEEKIGEVPDGKNLFDLIDNAETSLTASLNKKENTSNKVTTISSTSTDTQYPSAKAVYTELAKKQNNLTIDTALSSTSTNPVQNKVVNSALSAKQNANTAVTHTASTAAGSATVPVYVNASGVATAITSYSGKAATAGTADKATSDGNGNNIVNTYATKAQLNALDSTSSGTGAVVTAVSQTDGKVSVTKGNVQIPVGGASGTTYASIWVE